MKDASAAPRRMSPVGDSTRPSDELAAAEDEIDAWRAKGSRIAICGSWCFRPGRRK